MGPRAGRTVRGEKVKRAEVAGEEATMEVDAEAPGGGERCRFSTAGRAWMLGGAVWGRLRRLCRR